MARSTSQVTAIGLFVMAAILLALIMLLAFGSGKWFTRTVRYRIYLDSSVNGLSTGVPVKFRGVKVGQVTDISISSTNEGDSDDGTSSTGGKIMPPPFTPPIQRPENGSENYADNAGTTSFPITVTLELTPESFGFNRNWFVSLFTDQDNNVESTRELIKKLVIQNGMCVQMRTLSLLTGQKYLEMNISQTPLSQEEKKEREKMYLQNLLPVQITMMDRLTDEFTRKDITRHLRALTRLLHTLDDFVEAGKPRQFLDHMDAITRHLDETTAQMPQAIGDARAVLGSAHGLAGNMTQSLQALQETIASAKKLTDDVTTLVNDNRAAVPELLQELQKTVQNANNQLVLMQDILTQIRRDTADGSELRLKIDSLLDNCGNATNRLDALLEMLTRDPQVLLLGN